MFSQIAKFTKAANSDEIKKSPSPMDEKEVAFLCKMVISELMELVTTVLPENSEVTPQDFIHICCEDADSPKPYTGTNDVEKLAYQLDCCVDWCYYTGNISKKHTGMPDESLDEVFNEVHKANMNKIHPDGTVHRRADGKILKPEGWKEPDVISVIKRLLEKTLEKSDSSCDNTEKVEIKDPQLPQVSGSDQKNL